MTEEHEIICINCPLGCRVKVTTEGQSVTAVSGNGCPRGESYARQECIRPMRMLTAVIPCSGSRRPLSVRTDRPVPKDRIADCMAFLMKLEPAAPVHMGQVIAENILGTGADIIATGDMRGQENR